MVEPGTSAGSSACVVLDLDDTLFLERDYVRSGFGAVARWLAEAEGVEGFFAAAWALFEAGQRGTVFDQALARCGLAPTLSLVTDLVACYRTHRPDLEMLPDATDCLTGLRLACVRLAVVSDGPLASQRAKADAMACSSWADPVLLTAELAPGLAKPSPHPFRLIEVATGCHGGDCAYIADNPAKDFAGPKALGWQTIRVRRSGSLHEQVASGHDVDLEVEDLTGLAETLGLSVPRPT